MAGQLPISKLQLYSARSLSGLSEENNLRNAFLSEPAKMKTVVSYMLSNSYYANQGGGADSSVISLLTDGLGTTETINDSEYTWDIFGANERAIDILGNLGEGGSTIGYGNSPFTIIMAEKYFTATDTIWLDDKTQVRCQKEAYQGAGGWCYVVTLHGADYTAYVDPALISAGARASKAYSMVEEGSMRGGDLNMATPFKMKNRLSILRKNHACTRSAATTIMIMELPSMAKPNGPTTKWWFTLAEWTFMAQFGMERDKALLYGKASGNTPPAGSNGRPVLSGHGLIDQIAPANIRYINKMTYNLLDDVLSELSETAVATGGNTSFLALTGKQGMRDFSNAINDKFKSLGVNIIAGQGQFISGTGNNLVFAGDQWITANFPNGIKLTVRHMPLYDNQTDNRTYHPVTGKPIESSRFTIFNIGNNTRNGASVKRVVKANSEIYKITPGMYNPYDLPGTKKNFSEVTASGFDGFEIFALSEEGIMLADPTSAAEIRIAVS